MKISKITSVLYFSKFLISALFPSPGIKFPKLRETDVDVTLSDLQNLRLDTVYFRGS